MKRVTPLTSLEEAESAFDNGGRFYNLFTHAGDQEITGAELNKAAETFDFRYAAVFFALSVHELSATDREKLNEQLHAKLRKKLTEAEPRVLSPDDYVAQAEKSRLYIVEGTGTPVAEKSMITGTLMMPVVAGKVTTFMPIPISENFDVVEVAGVEQTCRVMVPRRKDTELPKRARWGGLAREATDKSGKATDEPPYLEAYCCTELPE